MVDSTAEAVGMYSTPTVEVIRTLIVASKRKGVFRRQTLELEYKGCRNIYSTWLLPSVTCGLSVSVRPSFCL